MPEINERVARVETKVDGLTDSMEDVKQYLARSADQRATQGEDIAVIKNTMLAFAKYQEKCDNERQDMETRLGVTEDYQSKQKKIVGSIAAIVTFLAYGGSKLLENSGDFFKKIGSIFA